MTKNVQYPTPIEITGWYRCLAIA